MEKKAHHSRADIFSQENAWADSEFGMSWAEKCFRKNRMQERGGVPAEESLLTLDNLHGQTTDKFKA